MSERIDLIAPGQLVVLRSGSFDMTIDGVDQERQLATCVWFCPASERVQIEQFAVHSLLAELAVNRTLNSANILHLVR
ncbi:hypothetical protein V1669_03795 [Aeromonas enteropelogenes]|uniref:hypothetical protein n=1 Tax=Aeromonas enteropelogenes TaxID=29489 RepID=UPI003134B5D5